MWMEIEFFIIYFLLYYSETNWLIKFNLQLIGSTSYYGMLSVNNIILPTLKTVQTMQVTFDTVEKKKKIQPNPQQTKLN